MGQGRTNCTPGATPITACCYIGVGVRGGGRSNVTLECLRSVLFQGVRLSTVLR